MVTANSSVDFFQDVSSLFFVDALQVRHREASLVQGVIQDREPDRPLLDLFSFFGVLREAPVLEVGYYGRHLAVCALDGECCNFFDTRVFLDFHRQIYANFPFF